MLTYMQISFTENYKATLVQLWLSIVSRKTENLFKIKTTTGTDACGQLESHQNTPIGTCAGFDCDRVIFSIIAGTGLCFGFVMESALISPGCFHYC